MPDINLLDDTSNKNELPADRKRPVPARPPTPMSSPSPSSGLEQPLKKPSAFGLWSRSLFRKSSDKKRPEPPAAKAAASVTAPTGSAPAAKTDEPPDIFDDIGADLGGPAKPVARLESAAPTGPRPGDFPPLPNIPAWTPTPPGSSAPPITPPAAPARPLPTPAVAKLPPLSAQKPSGLGSAPVAPQTRSNAVLPQKSHLRMPSLTLKKAESKPVEEKRTEMNLLPDDLVSAYDPKKKITTMVLVAVAAALVVGIAYVSLLLWKETVARRATDTSAQVNGIEAQIKSKDLQSDRQQAIVLRETNRTLEKLLNRHIYWTRFLEYFERYTLSTVKYPSGITLSPGGQIALTGSAPDLQTVVSQVEVYLKAKDFITSAAVNTVQKNNKDATVSFIIDLQFNPAILLRPVSSANQPATSTTNRNTNTTP